MSATLCSNLSDPRAIGVSVGFAPRCPESGHDNFCRSCPSRQTTPGQPKFAVVVGFFFLIKKVMKSWPPADSTGTPRQAPTWDSSAGFGSQPRKSFATDSSWSPLNDSMSLAALRFWTTSFFKASATTDRVDSRHDEFSWRAVRRATCFQACSLFTFVSETLADTS